MAPMELSATWYDAIAVRSSQRRYPATPLAADAAAHLRAFCAAVQPSPSARLVVVDSEVDRLFTGVLGNYGAVSGAPLAVAFVGRAGAEAEVGYLGEALVLEATSLGLGTCWIAGSFDKERADGLVELVQGERVMALTPVGNPLKRLPAGERLMRRSWGPRPGCRSTRSPPASTARRARRPGRRGRGPRSRRRACALGREPPALALSLQRRRSRAQPRRQALLDGAPRLRHRRAARRAAAPRTAACAAPGNRSANPGSRGSCPSKAPQVSGGA